MANARVVTLRVPGPLLERLEREAERVGSSRSAFILGALEGRLAPAVPDPPRPEGGFYRCPGCGWSALRGDARCPACNRRVRRVSEVA